MADELVAGRYRVEGEIGRGASATVFRARDTQLDRNVALKVIAGALANDGAFLARFEKEARFAAQLDHPSIVTVHDIGRLDDGRPFICMRLLEGKTLEDIVVERGALPPQMALSILRQVAAALDYTHESGYVHRDVKPSNIIVDNAGRATLTDFGIAHALDAARTTNPGLAIGTPSYMSPEQIRGETPVAATDIYALAVTAFELLAGRPPFEGNGTALMYRIVHEPPPTLGEIRPELPPGATTVLGRALEKEPKRRWQSAGDFMAALDASLATRTTSVPGSTLVNSGQVTPGTARRSPGTPLERVGRYEIRRQLGRGGMATVHLAHDGSFNREVAIKMLTGQVLVDQTSRERFLREARTVAGLEHPCIVPVYDFGEEDSQPYLVMRYLRGGTLQERMAMGKIERFEAVHVISRVASALATAHQRGIVHRDLKPGNILFDDAGEPYLSDFGIAHVAMASVSLTGGSTIGTPQYMSPEQAKGDRGITASSDIYSLGIVAYELLVGQPPFTGHDAFELLRKQVQDPPPPPRSLNPALSPEIEHVLLRALEKQPEGRFATVTDFAEALRVSALERTVVLPPQNFTPPATVPPAIEPAPQPVAVPTPATRAPEIEPRPAALTPFQPEPFQEAPAPTPVPAPAYGSSGDQPPPSNRGLIWGILGGVAVVAAAAVLAFVLFAGGGDEDDDDDDSGGDDEIEAAALLNDALDEFPFDQASANRVGDDDAPLKLTFFQDYQCADCLAYAAEDEPGIIEEYVKSGKVQIIFDHLPLLGEESNRAALAAECASDQGEFWEYSNRLFWEQAEAGQLDDEQLDVGRFGDDQLMEVASDVGLDAQKFSDCLEDETPLDRITESIDLADSIGVSGLPSFLVNGEFAGNDIGDLDDWREFLDAKLEEIEEATATPGATATPTPAGGWAAISKITVVSSRYQVEFTHGGFQYDLNGDTKGTHGQHVHFYWDNIPKEQAGAPGAGPWYLYFGTSPVTLPAPFTPAQKPAGAKNICIIPANPDHSIRANSGGNCMPVP